MEGDELQGTASERQIVVFSLGQEEFGVNINEVKEIIHIEEITHIPNTPSYVRGVINLRGSIIVVVDLATKLNLPLKEADKSTRIIFIEMQDNVVGMIVDSATEVLRLAASQIQPPPPVIAEKISAHYLEGVGILGERLLILLDLSRVLDMKDVNDLQKIQQTAASKTLRPSVPEGKGAAKPVKEKAGEPVAPASKSTKEVKAAKTGNTAGNTAEDASESPKEDATGKGAAGEKGAVGEKGTKNNAQDATENTETSDLPGDDHPTLQDVHQDCHFITHEGQPLKNVHDLLEYVRGLEEDRFKEFVNEEKNDFSNWIKHAVKDDELATKIQNIKSKNGVTKEIMNRILKIRLDASK